MASSKDHSDTFKDQFLTRLFGNFDRSNLSAPDCAAVFRVLTEWILSSDNQDLVRHGHQQLRALAMARRDSFLELVNPNMIIDIFTNPVNSNKVEMASLVVDILDMLQLQDLVPEEGPYPTENLLAHPQPSIDCGSSVSSADNGTKEADLRRSVTNVARYMLSHTSQHFWRINNINCLLPIFKILIYK